MLPENAWINLYFPAAAVDVRMALRSRRQRGRESGKEMLPNGRAIAHHLFLLQLSNKESRNAGTRPSEGEMKTQS